MLIKDSDERTKTIVSHKQLRRPIEEGMNLQEVTDLVRLQGRFYEMSAEQRKEALALEQQYTDLAAANQCPGDPLHPFYYHIYAQTLPPEAAYRIKRAEISRVSKSLEESQTKGFKRRYVF